jgi:hemerythrin-like domain-containing protein
MTSIPEYMTAKHRECDEQFIAAENAVTIDDWQTATEQFTLFGEELELHFQAEEAILFPRFEEETGITSGPTQVMRMEHQQMRALVNDLHASLTAADKQAYIGASETLMVLMQQHNMKEEMMLYPMTEQRLLQPKQVLENIVSYCQSQVNA